MKTVPAALLMLAFCLVAGSLPTRAKADPSPPTVEEISFRCRLIRGGQDPEWTTGLRIARARLSEALAAADDEERVRAELNAIDPGCLTLLAPAASKHASQLPANQTADDERTWSARLSRESQEETLREMTGAAATAGPPESPRPPPPPAAATAASDAGSPESPRPPPPPSPRRHQATVRAGAAPAALPPTESRIEPFFPWPPPQPFLSETMTRQAFPKELKTLQAVSDHLSSALSAAGYSDFRYFSIRDDGFAEVTRMERIDDQDRPFAGASRWEDSGALSISPDTFSVRDYLIALFRRRTGTFRVFVLLVTPENMIPDEEKQLRLETVQAWQSRGSLTLPDSIGRRPFSDRHKVYVLVYEFKKEEGETPRTVKEGTVADHLKAMGIRFGKPS